MSIESLDDARRERLSDTIQAAAKELLTIGLPPSYIIMDIGDGNVVGIGLKDELARALGRKRKMTPYLGDD